MLRKEGPKESGAEPLPPRGRAAGTDSESDEHLVAPHLTAPNVWKAVLILQQLLHHEAGEGIKPPPSLEMSTS